MYRTCSGGTCDESVGHLCDKHAAERSAHKGTNVLEFAETIGDVFRDNGHAEATIIVADLLLKWRAIKRPSGTNCDCYAMFGQPHFRDCPDGIWQNVPEQYKQSRWGFDFDEPRSTFFVHSGGHRICDAEDSEVAQAICNAFNATFKGKNIP